MMTALCAEWPALVELVFDLVIIVIMKKTLLFLCTLSLFGPRHLVYCKSSVTSNVNIDNSVVPLFFFSFSVSLDLPLTTCVIRFNKLLGLLMFYPCYVFINRKSSLMIRDTYLVADWLLIIMWYLNVIFCREHILCGKCTGIGLVYDT